MDCLSCGRSPTGTDVCHAKVSFNNLTALPLMFVWNWFAFFFHILILTGFTPMTDWVLLSLEGHFSNGSLIIGL